MDDGELLEFRIGKKIASFRMAHPDGKLPPLPAIYMISSQELIRALAPAPYPYQILGLGLAANLREEAGKHPEWNRWIDLGADVILYHVDGDSQKLRDLYDELAEMYKDYNF